LKRVRRYYKRGLSTVVASAILLSAVAVLGTAVVGWSNSNLNIHQTELQTAFSSNLNKLNENVVFEYVWFGTNFVNITLANVGTVGLDVNTVEFVDPDNAASLHKETLSNGKIFPNKSISPQITYSWTSGQTFDVVITTARGVIFRTQVLPP